MVDKCDTLSTRNNTKAANLLIMGKGIIKGELHPHYLEIVNTMKGNGLPVLQIHADVQFKNQKQYIFYTGLERWDARFIGITFHYN